MLLSADAQEPATPVAPQEPASGVAPTVRLRVYADVGFGRPLQEKLPVGGLQASEYSFQIADLHLFITSNLSEEWSFLTEALFTSDFTNESGSELDRMLVQYNPNRHLKIAFGKFNSGIGYYPNQFHRAKFFQTATGRPMMFTDEDNGGFLPVHQVGVSAQGQIPSGGVGLHYIAEVGNGRAFSEHSAEIPNWTDTNGFKAFNGGVFVKPDAAPALDAGFTMYWDTIESDALEKFRETIFAAHAVWVTPNFEFLNEVAVLTHKAEVGDAEATSKAFYTQVSRRFAASVRPYFRYEYQDVPEDDPVYPLGGVVPPLGVRKAVSVGLNYGIGVFAVVKVQYDRALQYGVWANGAHAQLAIAF